MSERLDIQLLGGVAVRYGNKEIGMGNADARSGKMWTLFKYLVLNSGRIVPQDELIDRLWPEMDVANPANSLKVLVFKLRKELDSLGGIQGRNVILTADGGYCFNTSADYVLDIDTFDRYLEQARDSLEKDEKISLLLSAIGCYRGNIYVEPKRGSWAMPIQTHYAERYERAVRTLAGLLLEKGQYQKIVDICKDALLIQPYSEEFYYYMIRAYTKLENYSAAADMYRQVQRVMNNEFGARPDARFETAYREILKKKPKGHLTMEEIQRDLQEDAGETAFFVEYGEFKQLYRFMARQAACIRKRTYLCLYSLRVQKGTQVSKDIRRSHVQVLREALRFGLRKSDVFCHASTGQFVVLLVDVSDAQEQIISRKVREYFDRNKKERGIFVVYSSFSIGFPVSQEKLEKIEKMTNLPN